MSSIFITIQSNTATYCWCWTGRIPLFDKYGRVFIRNNGEMGDMPKSPRTTENDRVRKRTLGFGNYGTGMLISIRKLNWFVAGMVVFTFISLCLVIYVYIVSFRLMPVDGQLLYASSAYYGPERGGRPSWQLVIKYRYQYEGTSYEGSRLYVGGNGMGIKILADSKVESLGPFPHAVTVCVDPRNPNYSVLERGAGLSTWILFGIFVALTGVLYRYMPRR